MKNTTAAIESAKRARRVRAAIDDGVAVTVVVMCGVTGWWQGFAADAMAWKAWLLGAALYLPMWVMAKASR